MADIRVRIQKKALLTLREQETLEWLKRGKSTAEIARVMGISARTVKFHISNIMEKLNAVNRAHALAISIEKGLLE